MELQHVVASSYNMAFYEWDLWDLDVVVICMNLLCVALLVKEWV